MATTGTRLQLIITITLALSLCLSGAVAAQDEDEGSSGLSLDDLIGGGSSDDSSAGAISSFSQGQGSFEGQLLTKMATDVSHEGDAEDVFDWRSLAYARGFYQFNRTFYASVSGLFDYRLAYGEDTSTEYLVDLYEGYLDIIGSWGALRTGQQLVSWGRADLINPTSVINPPDLERFLDVEMGYGREPVLAAKGDLYRGPVRFEAVYAPFFTPAPVKIIGADWALLRQQFPLEDLLCYLDEQVQSDKWQELLDFLVPQWRDELRDFLNDEKLITDNIEQPADDFQNGSGAARLGLSFTSLDCSLMYGYTWDYIPTLYINPEVELLLKFIKDPTGSGIAIQDIDLDKLDPPLRGVYHRIHTFGGDFSTVVKGVGLVFEGAVSSGRRTYDDQLKPQQGTWLTYVVQADHLFSGQFYVGGSMIQSIQLDWYDELLTERVNTYLALLLRRPFMDEKIEAALLTVLDPSGATNEELEVGDLSSISGLITPLVSFSLTQDLRLNTGANLLWGDDDTLEGYFRENSQVFVSLKYSF
ncbi:MAG: hypothetical protein P9M14_01055 [Candidatus Alcyoniella australis]|nr:hypothetical protein [Candidatus Alcyoniella australis]